MTYHARNDFNGDGRSDILWRDDSGTITDWLGTANGGFAVNWSNFSWDAPQALRVAGTGDFNGDGREDFLMLATNAAGTASSLTTYVQTISSGFQYSLDAWTSVPTEWKLVGTGDFNGDGSTDILWRNNDGQLTDWLFGSGNDGIVDVPGVAITRNWDNAHYAVPTNMSIAGIDDFNGDGRADILWRRDDGLLTVWLGQANGGFDSSSAHASAMVPLSWTVAGTGDFNGDGKADILWRNTDGVVVDWLGQADGTFARNWNNSARLVSNDWHVVETGDYNGDHRSDILWRNDDGTLTDWLGNTSGGFNDNWDNSVTLVPTHWHVLPDGAGIF